MAQPDTLDRRMDALDRLVLLCRKPGCAASFVATKAQAMRRFGAHATSYEVEQYSRCPDCGSADVDVAIASAHELKTVPERDRITFADVVRHGLEIAADCAPCRLGLRPAATAFTRCQHRPLARVFAEQVIRCHKCRLPVCGLSVLRPSPAGGGSSEAVHAFWEPGSPCDPVVKAFWTMVRISLNGR